jgi:hypothetical protein
MCGGIPHTPTHTHPQTTPACAGAFDVPEQAAHAHDIGALCSGKARAEALNFPLTDYESLLPMLHTLPHVSALCAVFVFGWGGGGGGGGPAGRRRKTWGPTLLKPANRPTLCTASLVAGLVWGGMGRAAMRWLARQRASGAAADWCC